MEPQLDIIDHAEDRPVRQKRADDELDMTPMVDVTFLLLIFFMITAAFALQKSLEVPRVQEDEAAASRVVDDFQNDTITVRVDGDNVYWIGAPIWDEEQRAPSVQEMLVQLRHARAGRVGSSAGGPSRMLVQANGDAVHEKVVAAVDAGMSVGMEDIQLMSYEEGEL